MIMLRGSFALVCQLIKYVWIYGSGWAVLMLISTGGMVQELEVPQVYTCD